MDGDKPLCLDPCFNGFQPGMDEAVTCALLSALPQDVLASVQSPGARHEMLLRGVLGPMEVANHILTECRRGLESQNSTGSLISKNPQDAKKASPRVQDARDGVSSRAGSVPSPEHGWTRVRVYYDILVAAFCFLLSSELLPSTLSFFRGECESPQCAQNSLLAVLMLVAGLQSALTSILVHSRWRVGEDWLASKRFLQIFTLHCYVCMSAGKGVIQSPITVIIVLFTGGVVIGIGNRIGLKHRLRLDAFAQLILLLLYSYMEPMCGKEAWGCHRWFLFVVSEMAVTLLLVKAGVAQLQHPHPAAFHPGRKECNKKAN